MELRRNVPEGGAFLASRLGAVNAFGLLFLVAASGCGAAPERGTGSERQHCFANSTCNAGLTCLSNFCVRVDLDGGVPAPDGDASSRNDSDGGVATDASDAVTSGSGGDAAAHPRLPQISNQGGPVLDHPRVQPIYYATDSDAPDIESFLQEMTKTTAWHDLTSEYGVGPLSVAAPIMIPGGAPLTMTDEVLGASVASNVASGSSPWGAADPSTIYMIVLPQGSTVTFSNGGTCCSDFGGYHNETTNMSGITVPYAVICTCPAAFGLNLSPLDARTTTVSHELVEAATDPFPNTNPAYQGADRANVVWDAVTGGELADMCALYPDANVVPAGGTYMIQRSWSNAAAAASRNPCVPRAQTTPAFGSYPLLDSVNAGTAKNPFITQGVKVLLGESQTIDVVLSGDGPRDLTWSVGVYTYEDLRGGDTTNLGVSLDKNSGKNGDVLHLTLGPKHTNPDLGADAFILISRAGSGGALQSNVSMGLVTTQ
jgi:hypothetical protein